MAVHPVASLLGYFRRLSSPAGTEEDALLLTRHLSGDGAAFAGLVHRHAGLVWATCSRVLGAGADAEDAFQATFVVLLQKAASLADGRPLGPWLHRVASRAAAKLRLGQVRRAARETAAARPVPPPNEGSLALDRAEMRRIIDEELDRLPDHYRQPAVLCYLEGLSCEEAAERLACPRGTILSRLSRARDRLRERLTRRGLDAPAAGIPAVLALAGGAVPPALVNRFLQTAAAGPAAFSPLITSLAKGVISTMFWRQRDLVLLACLTLVLTASGAGLLAGLGGGPHRGGAAEAAATPPPPVVADGEEKPGNEKAGKEEKKPAARSGNVEEALGTPTRFQLENRTPLVDVVEMLGKMHDIPIHVNRKAFTAEGITDVSELTVEPFPLAGGKPVEAPLGSILRTLLGTPPADPTGAVFLVREGYLEITTRNAAVAELGLAERPEPFILTNGTFRQVPLEKALETLSRASGVNVVLDARVGEKGQSKVSGTFRNVQIDTAVEVLADVAGLGVARNGNVLYVTSPENATRLSGRWKAAAEVSK